MFMSREHGLKEEWPEIQRTGEQGAVRSLGPERLVMDLLLHAEMEKAAVVGRSYPWRTNGADQGPKQEHLLPALSLKAFRPGPFSGVWLSSLFCSAAW